MLCGDPLGCGDPVQNRHLDIEDHEIGAELGRKLNRGLPVGGLARHNVTFLLKHLLEVKSDQRLVFGDYNSKWGLAHGHERTRTG